MISLAGCGLGPNAARATLQATASPLVLPTETYPPTATEYPPTSTATATPTASATPEGGAATATAGTETPAAETATTAPAGTAQAGVDKAEFVADVTVPDGTNFTPGEAFVKTWRVRNSGTTTWGTDYVLAYARGAQMGGAATVPLPNTVAPGAEVDISVDMTAPTALGSHTGFWQLRTGAGTPFGIGAEANEPVYVQINVTVATNATAGPTSAAAGALRVSGVTLSVEPATFTGPCPQTFVFSTALTSEGAGTATYRLQAVTTTPGFDLTLPDTSQSQFTGAGPRTFNGSYSLEFNGSVSGEAWIDVLTPNTLESNRVSFSLTCQAAE